MRIRGAEIGVRDGHEDSNVVLATHGESALVEAQRFGELPLQKVDISPTPVREDQAVGVVEGLGNSDCLLSVGEPFLELPPLSQGLRQHPAGHHGGEPGEAAALTALLALEQRDNFPEKALGRSVVAKAGLSPSKVKVRADADRKIVEIFSDGLCRLSGFSRFRQVAGYAKI